jgi:hypothetical protein
MLVLPNICEKKNLKLYKYTFLGSFFGNFSDNHTTVAVENKKIIICVEFWVDNVIFTHPQQRKILLCKRLTKKLEFLSLNCQVSCLTSTVKTAKTYTPQNQREEVS